MLFSVSVQFCRRVDHSLDMTVVQLGEAVAAVESGRGIALSTLVFKQVTGKRLVYRPLTGTNEVLSVGIARAKNGDITPAGEKFCEIL